MGRPSVVRPSSVPVGSSGGSWQRVEDVYRRPGPQWGVNKRTREEDDNTGRASEPRRVKVTNVPFDLDSRDIKEAFESAAGKIVSCDVDVERGCAWMLFARPEHARKAVATF